MSQGLQGLANKNWKVGFELRESETSQLPLA